MMRLALFGALVGSSLAVASAWVSTTGVHYQHLHRHGALSSSLSAVKTDAEIISTVREGLEERDYLTAWDDCLAWLLSADSGLNYEPEQAEMILAMALDWRAWGRVSLPIARKYMKPKQPDLEQLQTALQWLKEGPLALTGDTLANAIEEAPAAYLVNPEGKYQKALDTAPKMYKDPASFKEILLEVPSVMECSYNCALAEDGCASECGNCWVTFQTANLI